MPLTRNRKSQAPRNAVITRRRNETSQTKLLELSEITKCRFIFNKFGTYSDQYLVLQRFWSSIHCITFCINIFFFYRRPDPILFKRLNISRQITDGGDNIWFLAFDPFPSWCFSWLILSIVLLMIFQLCSILFNSKLYSIVHFTIDNNSFYFLKAYRYFLLFSIKIDI